MNLLKFCWPDDTRPKLQKPFSRDGYTYATDGSIIVRVQKMDEWPDDTGPVWEPKEFFKFEPGFRDEAILNVPIRWDYETCDDELCLYNPSQKCTACFGAGFFLKSKPIIQHNGFKLNQIYVDKIRNLKNLKTYFPDPESTLPGKDTCFFEFDGGCGLIMGIR